MTDSTERTGPAGTIPAGLTARSAGARPATLMSAGWHGFRSWRRSRPFWAGILLIIAGAELLLIPLPLHSMGLILHIGVGGVSGILIGAVLIVAGLLLWFNPAQRMFYSIVAVLLAIAALVASNLGGFLVGTALGVIGGSLGFAWTPLPPGTEPRRLWRPRPRVPAAAGLADVLAEASDPTGQAEPAEQDAVADLDVLPEPDPAGEPGPPTHQDTAAEPGAPIYQDAIADDLRDHPASARVVNGAVEPATGHEHGTVLRAFALIPVLALLLAPLTGLINLLDPNSAASSSPSACSTTTASPAPSPSPSASCSPSPSPSTDPTPDPTPAPSPSASPGHAADPSASASVGSASPSPSPSPTPSGTPPSFAVSAAQSTLTASSATITGFAYDGVVSVPTSSGSVQMMQFTATSLDLSGMQLTVSQGGGTMTTTADALDLTGNVVLYATELSGDLFGIPLTITPNTPIADILQVLGQAGLSQTLTQVVPLQMTNVMTLQPFTSANGMSTSDLQIS
jgi:hypothetical protein